MLRSKKLLVGLTVAATATLGGCGADLSAEERPAATSAAPHGPLDGQRYASFSVRGERLITGTRIRLAFFDGEVSFTTGCSLGQGHYRLERGELVVRRTLATMVGCSEPRAAQDAWLGHFIERLRVSRPGEDQLRLTDGDVTVELEREP